MLIGINGFKGAGKDTVGAYLVEKYDFQRLAFATKLKEAVGALLDISVEDVDYYKSRNSWVGVEEGMMMGFRPFLQRFGTEMGREVFGENFWIEQVIPPDANSYWHKGRKIAVTDVRFDNEIRAIRRVAGHIIRVERPGYEPDDHLSEQYPNEELIDYAINNHQDIDYLHKLVDCCLDDIADQEIKHGTLR